MDLFEEYLKMEEKPELIEIALTDKSYKHYYEEINSKPYTGEYNKDLGTYGDAILKVCFLNILLEEKSALPTEEKKKYESDETLVKVIAKRYKLIDEIHYDENDDKKPKNYKFESKSASKYIATCVEALVAAIYIEESKKSPDEAMKLIIDLARHWKQWCNE